MHLKPRISEHDLINAQGRALRCMMNGMHMPILNGMQLFPGTNGTTCFSASGGHSVLDYALAHVDALPDIKSFKIGEKHP